MTHDAAASLYFDAPFFDRYLDFAFAGVLNDEVVARAFSVPFAFPTPERGELPDGGWDDVIRWAHEGWPWAESSRLSVRLKSACFLMREAEATQASFSEP